MNIAHELARQLQFMDHLFLESSRAHDQPIAEITGA